MTMKFVGVALTLMFALTPAGAARDTRAADVLARTRKALGDKKLESLKALSLQASTQRNVGQMQMSSDVEIAIEMPDKYARTETGRGMMSMTMTTGFNGDTPLMPAGAMSMGGGGAMVIRMGPGGVIPNDGPKPTPEEQERLNKAALRAQRTEISRLMLGWLGMAHPSLAAEYTYAGEAESPDGKAHVIDVKNADGFSARLFIDQNNHLPLMVTYRAPQPRVITAGGPGTRAQGAATGPHGAQGQQTAGRELTDEERKKLMADAQKQLAQEAEQPQLADFTLFFDDWREVDGIHFPHVMRRAMASETTEEWTITKVRVNPKLDAKTFAADSK